MKLEGAGGTERQGFLLVEGGANGRLSWRLRAANSPHQRTDGTQTPDFRGVIEPTTGPPSTSPGTAMAGHRVAARQLLGSITHLSEDARYSWLNQAICVLTGEVRPKAADRFEVVLEVSELIWEPISRPEK